jgi:CBS-domain-containing membrane protein
MMRVGEVMTRIEVCLSEDNTCAEALQLLSDCNCSGLPVIDKTGKLLGVVTTKSLIERLCSNDRSFADLSCLAAVGCDLVVIRPSLLLENAWASQFDLAVVIGDDGRIVGMLSREDLAVALYRKAKFQIKEQAKEFEAILSSLQNGIIVIDKDGRIPVPFPC